MDKFMQQMREAFANEALWKEFQTGIWDTIYSTVAATLVACVLGIILGIILVAGEEDGVRPLPGPVMKVLNFAINILRSVPFLILMIMVLPLSELLVGTTIGTVASIPPLIIASASFVPGWWRPPCGGWTRGSSRPPSPWAAPPSRSSGR